MSPVLSASGVSVRIGAKELLSDVGFAAQAGETIALVGPNGAGKSTLLRVLSGELQPHAGNVTVKGRAISSYGPRELALCRAVLSQSVAVSFPFTVAEIVAMGAGERGGARIDALVENALAEVDLAGFHDRIVTTLSGGEQQRAHFARVLVQLACGEEACGPGVLLLDEPTASLDLRHQLDIVRAAKSCAARGIAVVAILHDLNLAAMLAQKVIVLDAGRLVAAGPPSKVIVDDVLERVFGIAGAVGRVPSGEEPFVLLQNAVRRQPESRQTRGGICGSADTQPFAENIKPVSPSMADPER